MDLNAVFSALSDPTRRAILARLAAGEASVTELGAPFSLSQPAISKHLNVLEKAGLIQKGRDGQRRPCRIEVEPLEAANQWLEQYRQLWERNYQRLDDLLSTLTDDAKKHGEPRPRNRKTKTRTRTRTRRRK